MPAPVHADLSEGKLRLTEQFPVSLPQGSDTILRGGVARLLTAWGRRSAIAISAPLAKDDSRPGLTVDRFGPVQMGTPELGQDESYTVRVSAKGAVLRAETDAGILAGLSTLQQLLQRDTEGWFLPCVSIRDQPRFPWRGLMIDVSRHWEPIEVIRRNLDGMALVKLNVLHLHLTDDQGFRIEIKSHPELTERGSDGNFFTQQQIKDIVSYASERGIRVVPEMDLPGHATSWFVSHPELASAPGPYRIERHWGVFNPVMDPTNEAAYKLIEDVFTEVAALFPDPFFHIGGDENNGVQWKANPKIQAFIKDHGLRSNAGLQAYFNQRIAPILGKLHKRVIGWDEILDPALPKNIVIESWRGSASLSHAARLGYDGILANGYYIDLCHPASDHYSADPLIKKKAPKSDEDEDGPELTLSQREQARVLGGEATMWGEWVDPKTIDSRIWPRTAAIAERLWSPAGVRDFSDMYRRLQAVSERLEEEGLEHRTYRRPLLANLIAGSADPDSLATVSAFIGAIQPVQGYDRGEEQPGSDQWTPLVGVADAAQPDSEACRSFASEVDRCLEGPAKDRPEAIDNLRSTLAAWLRAGQSLASPTGISARAPALAPAAPVAAQLADACVVAVEALDAISAGKTKDADWKAAALGRLEADAEGHDGVQIGALPALRKLVLSASKSP
jgi:hexosaminidase